jgi:hypothetical protein
MKTLIAAAVLTVFMISSCSIIPNTSKRKYNPLIRYVGVGSTFTDDGVPRVTEPRTWKRAVDRMENSFPGSEPVVIWTVGTVNKKNTGVTLGFPSAANLPYIMFASNDVNERYLRYFDMKAINVFLRVEPGFAPVEKVLELALARYTNHPCVAGIGVDGGWFSTQDPGGGKKITDALAQSWEKTVKDINTNYRLFIQQDDPAFQPPVYRGDIIFMSGNGGEFRSVQELSSRMTEYSDRFYPNLVFFQVGYPADMHWWKRFKKPQERLGDALAEKVRQECGIVWVDLTLKEALLK